MAQLALTYSYSFPDEQKYKDYVCILSVLAQVAIDSAKRSFDIDINKEIDRIKKDMNIKEHKYPKFWTLIRRDFNKVAEKAYKDMKRVEKIDSEDTERLKRYYVDEEVPETKKEILDRLKETYEKKNKINEDLVCPMNYLYDLDLKKAPSGNSVNVESTLPMSEFFIKHDIPDSKRRTCIRIEELIHKYSLDLSKKQQEELEEEDYILLRDDFEQLVEDLKRTKFPENYLGFMSWLIDRTFVITKGARKNKHNTKTLLNKNKSIFIKTLYNLNHDSFMKCWKRTKEE